MKRLITATFLILMGTSAQALAAATQEEAARLTSALQTYLGTEPGVVNVTPSGDSYDTRIDLTPLIAKVKQPGFSAQVTPLVFTLTSQGGGKWKVDQDQPLSASLKIEGAVDMKLSAAGGKRTGIFDEALGAFESQNADMTNLAFEQTITDRGMISRVNYTIGQVQYEASAEAATGGIDTTSKWVLTDLRETVDMSAAADGSTPPMQFSIAAPGATQTGTVKGLKTHEINALVAWLVAHQSPEAIKADQAGLKDKLRAAIPMFQRIETAASVNDLSINTILGRFVVAKSEFAVDMNGITDDGSLREKVSFSGLTLPDNIVPPWAKDLVPDKFTIDFNIADFNLAAPANMVIDNFDLNQDPPLKPELKTQLLQSLLPKGTVALALGPSEIIAKLFDLKLEGSMSAGPMAPPAGQASVQLKGLDDVMATLQSAPPEMGLQQMTPMILVAKGMAKTEADGTLTWKIESTPAGGMLVNGVDVTKMGVQ